MNATDPIEPVVVPPVPLPQRTVSTAPATNRRSSQWAFVWLLLLIAIAIAGYLWWEMRRIEIGRETTTQAQLTQGQSLRDELDAVTRKLDAVGADTLSQRARLADAAKVNESLRAQLLGLTERARLAEDAIANLAQTRLSGHDALLLNEAELLLVLAAERYRLLADPAPTLAIYRLADAALAEANDAAFSTVRQSIQSEIQALQALQAVDVPAVEAQLSLLRERAMQLPLAPRATQATAATDGVEAPRWWQIFGAVIRVRHDGDLQSDLSHNEPALAHALLDIQLRDAQAALLLRDTAGYQQALTRARTLAMHDFDTAAASSTQFAASLDQLAAVVIAPAAPVILGAALRELRNLRSTHALHPEPTPAPQAPNSASAPVGQT